MSCCVLCVRGTCIYTVQHVHVALAGCWCFCLAFWYAYNCAMWKRPNQHDISGSETAQMITMPVCWKYVLRTFFLFVCCFERNTMKKKITTHNQQQQQQQHYRTMYNSSNIINRGMDETFTHSTHKRSLTLAHW